MSEHEGKEDKRLAVVARSLASSLLETMLAKEAKVLDDSAVENT